MNNLEQRKRDIKQRIAALSGELQSHLQAVENIRTRIGALETDLDIVREQIREEEKRKAA